MNNNIHSYIQYNPSTVLNYTILSPKSKMSSVITNSKKKTNHTAVLNTIMRKRITQAESKLFTGPRRTLRNYKKVDYTGMDTIEPESEYDGITNIWADQTIYSDPDYLPYVHS